MRMSDCDGRDSGKTQKNKQTHELKHEHAFKCSSLLLSRLSHNQMEMSIVQTLDARLGLKCLF